MQIKKQTRLLTSSTKLLASIKKIWGFDRGERDDAENKVMPDTHLYVHTLPLNNYVTLFISGYEGKEQCGNRFAEVASLYFFMDLNIFFHPQV